MRFIDPFHLKWITLAFITAISISCSGGGSGGSDGISAAAFSYNGTTEQAVITEDNAEKLVMGSYSGGQIGAVTASDGTSRSLAYEGPVVTGYDNHLFNLMRSHAKGLYFDPIVKNAAPRAARSVNNVVNGSCGGSLSVSLTINENSGKFSGSFDYRDYCDYDVVINGRGNMSGLYDFTQDRPTQVHISFGSMAMEYSDVLRDFSGWIDVGLNSDGTETADMDIYLRDSAGDKIYWLSNFRVVYTPGPGHVDAEMTGRYYDPEFGYVVLRTVDPVRYDFNHAWPIHGHVVLAGKDNAAIDVTFDQAGFCRIEVDMDGDGQHDINQDIWFDVPEEGNRPPTSDYGELTFVASGSPTDCAEQRVAFIDAKVYDAEHEIIASGGPWSCDAGQVAIPLVPFGSDRTVVVLATDVYGDIIYRGQKTGISVIPDIENNAGAIDLFTFVPSLQAPANEAVVLAGEVVLQWEEVEEAAMYRVVVSQNNDMSDPLIEATTTTARQTLSGLSSEQPHYWMVVAIDSNHNIGKTSQIWSFTSSKNAI